MTYHSLDQIFDEIEATRGRLIARVEGLTDDERNYRPAPEVWSAADVIEHLARIETNMVRLVNKLLGKAEAAGVVGAGDGSIKPISMDDFNRAANAGKFEAPEALRPVGEMTYEQALAGLRATRAELLALRPRLAAVDGSDVTFPHPYAGPLNLYQWLAFIGLHEQRHLDQIERTVPQREARVNG